MKPLSAQLACAKRELALRQSAYPKWVKAGKMTQQNADDEIEGMQAVVDTIQKLIYLQETSEWMKANLK